MVTPTNNSFAELAGTDNPNTDSVSGTINFNDVDLSDRPTVTAPFSGYTYIAADGITALTLTAPQQTAILNALVLGPTPPNTSNGSVTWTYSVADKALDFLAQNETVTLTYTATVNDHNGGIVTQPLTVTIHGTNDAPVIKYTGSYSFDQFNTQDYGGWVEVGNNSNGAVNGNPLDGEFQIAHDPMTAAGRFPDQADRSGCRVGQCRHADAHVQSCWSRQHRKGRIRLPARHTQRPVKRSFRSLRIDQWRRIHFALGQ